MKRKGEEYGATPPLSVMQSPSAEYKTIELPLPQLDNNGDVFSPFSPPSSNLSWDTTRDAMNKLIAQCTVTSSSFSSKVSTTMKEIQSAIPTLQTEEETIRTDAQTILSRIQSNIQSSKSELSREQGMLLQAQQHIAQLEMEVSQIQSSHLELQAEESMLQKKIELYTAQANEALEVMDKVEVQQKEQVYRLQTQISLHALVSGIKWDFDVGMDTISGEIQVNPQDGRSVYSKRFELIRADYSSAELANILWDMMEA